MDLGHLIILWIQHYMANADVYFPIVLSFIILAMAASITFYLHSDLLRLITIVLLAGFFYWTSVGGTEFEQEYFLNMSTELIGTIIALVIFASAMTSDSWTFPVVATVTVFLISILTIRTDDFSNGFSLNLSTELLGAFLTTILLKRDWIWEKDDDIAESGLISSISDWFVDRLFTPRKFNTQDGTTDYVMIVSADNEIELAEKVEWITRSGVTMTRQSEVSHNFSKNRVYQEIGLAIDTYEKQAENVTLSNQEARMRVLAYPDTAYRVHKQIAEVVECDEPRHVHTTFKELAHLEFTAYRPRVLFSDYVSTQLKLLVREWRDNHNDNLKDASVHLMDWAMAMNFVKGQMDD